MKAIITLIANNKILTVIAVMLVMYICAALAGLIMRFRNTKQASTRISKLMLSGIVSKIEYYPKDGAKDAGVIIMFRDRTQLITKTEWNTKCPIDSLREFSFDLVIEAAESLAKNRTFELSRSGHGYINPQWSLELRRPVTVTESTQS